MHMGKISDDEWLPYFASKAMGDVLLLSAQQNPSIKFLVLSGHTHSEANYQPLSNLTIKAGRAEYGRPELQEVIML